MKKKATSEEHFRQRNQLEQENIDLKKLVNQSQLNLQEYMEKALA